MMTTKIACLSLLAFASSAMAQAPDMVLAKDAINHVGEYAMVCGVIDLLRPPLEALQLAREIRLVVAGEEPMVFPVTVPLPSSLLTYDESIGE